MRHRAVLDASAAIHVVCSLPSQQQLLEVLAETALVLVPHLFVSEVANTLWKYVAHGSLSRDEAVELLGEARKLTDVRVSDDDLATEALLAAATYGHPVYDMLYAVLARRHGAAVITMDRRLTSALEKMQVEFVLGRPGRGS